eukprot:5438823-Pleurochrysis_carterae.AAC.1
MSAQKLISGNPHSMYYKYFKISLISEDHLNTATDDSLRRSVDPGRFRRQCSGRYTILSPIRKGGAVYPLTILGLQVLRQCVRRGKP